MKGVTSQEAWWLSIDSVLQRVTVFYKHKAVCLQTSFVTKLLQNFMFKPTQDLFSLLILWLEANLSQLLVRCLYPSLHSMEHSFC